MNRPLNLQTLASPQPITTSSAVSALSAPTGSNTPIIVHSHLRWDYIWQRPQQLLSRFAADHPILFVEEPMESATEPTLDLSFTREGITRVVPLLPAAGSLSTDARCAMVLPLLESALRTHPLLTRRFESPVQWFYSPMTAPRYYGKFDSVGTVYDCMEELSNFRLTPPDVAARENYLLEKADVVFTSGYELYCSKSARHGNTHFFGCGVDADHFAQAHAANTLVPGEVAGLPGAILGYFGVIDERLDYGLIAELAHRVPHASIVLVGPLGKVREADLPRASNIHWLGARSYQDLPALLKAFDICLMPFAINAATQYINPTKTLEYLAAGKPVVSTAVPDVVRQYTDIVDIADCIDSYIELVEKRLVSVDPTRIARGITRARSCSWESTVSAMRDLMINALARKRIMQYDFLPSPGLPSRRFVKAKNDD